MLAQSRQGLLSEALYRRVLGGLARLLEFGDVLSVILYHVFHVRTIKLFTRELLQARLRGLILGVRFGGDVNMLLLRHLLELIVGFAVVIDHPLAELLNI